MYPLSRFAIGQLQYSANLWLADSSGFRIFNLFGRGSQATYTESVIKSADYAMESAVSNTDSNADPVTICLCVRAFFCYMYGGKQLLEDDNASCKIMSSSKK